MTGQLILSAGNHSKGLGFLDVTLFYVYTATSFCKGDLFFTSEAG